MGVLSGHPHACGMGAGWTSALCTPISSRLWCCTPMSDVTIGELGHGDLSDPLCSFSGCGILSRRKAL